VVGGFQGPEVYSEVLVGLCFGSDSETPLLFLKFGLDSDSQKDSDFVGSPLVRFASKPLDKQYLC